MSPQKFRVIKKSKQFDAGHLKNFRFHNRKTLLCSRCKKEETQQTKLLHNRIKTSKRKKCTCGSKGQHAEKCPMHFEKIGERSFPYCDVLTRLGYDWLAARNLHNP